MVVCVGCQTLVIQLSQTSKRFGKNAFYVPYAVVEFVIARKSTWSVLHPEGNICIGLFPKCGTWRDIANQKLKSSRWRWQRLGDVVCGGKRLSVTFLPRLDRAVRMGGRIHNFSET